MKIAPRYVAVTGDNITGMEKDLMANGNRFDNFDEANIADVRKRWDEEEKNGPIKRQVYTMVQSNAPCEVKITEESRRLCAEALLK
jgi:hypothetical protein